MRRISTCLAVLLILAVMAGSCGTTVYRGRAYKSPKYINYKSHWHWWHEHHYRPHEHYGGYW